MGAGRQHHLAIGEIAGVGPGPVEHGADRADGLRRGHVAGMSRQVAGHGVCVNNILPGIHATDRADSLDKGVADKQGIDMDQARAQRQATIPTGTYGDPGDFGATCAFLCSQQARFIVGQNVLLDGGALNVTV